MWKDRGPGVKILWIWTFGTAAVLVTSVVRTRLKDMDQFINATQQQPQPNTKDAAGSDILIDDNPPAGNSIKIDH